MQRSSLGSIDTFIVLIYLFLITLIGVYFAWRKRGPESFVRAEGRLAFWVVGLSIFGTFLSSNTFIGVTGKAFGSNWNSFVFSLTLPLAAFIAVKYFVPFYRRAGFVSAYEHMENRFGQWARTYMVACYLLTQLARTASILFGVSLVLAQFIHVDLALIIIVSGILITLYTFLGGIEAVIWSDVLQSIILMLGAIYILFHIISHIPGGFPEMVSAGMNDGKFNLGSWSLTIDQSTFWVVLFYGIFINLNNFGVDQSYIQRYHAASSVKAAGRSVWLAAGLYIPVSLLFFTIGTALYVYMDHYPDIMNDIKTGYIHFLSGNALSESFSQPGEITHEMVADSVLPYYMSHLLPQGLGGLLIAALFSAAMSSIDTGLNSSATICWTDLYKRYIVKDPGKRQSMLILRGATIFWGFAGTLFAILLIGTTSILDTWWKLSGIFAGGMLGLFLLGLVSRKTDGHLAAIAVITGTLVIIWLTFSHLLPATMDFLKSPFHANMIVVIGTLSIFAVGLIVTKFKK